MCDIKPLTSSHHFLLVWMESSWKMTQGRIPFTWKIITSQSKMISVFLESSNSSSQTYLTFNRNKGTASIVPPKLICDIHHFGDTTCGSMTLTLWRTKRYLDQCNSDTKHTVPKINSQSNLGSKIMIGLTNLYQRDKQF